MISNNKCLALEDVTTLFPQGCSSFLSPICLVAIFGLVGCGSDLPCTVIGTVSYQGNPIPNAMIAMQAKEQGPGAYAMTDSLGSFELRTGGRSGVLPGTYLFCLQPPQDFELPVKYGSVVTSGLEYEIKPGKNELEIFLE